MPRIRTIKPEFFTSLTIASLSFEARLTFIGLWTQCDDEGRCVDNARLIKAALWPLDDRTAKDVEGDLEELTKARLIVRYSFTEGSLNTHGALSERYWIAVCGWREHQRINRPSESKIPSPPGPVAPPKNHLRPAETPHSLRTHGGLTEDSLQERKGKEQGKELGAHPPLPPSGQKLPAVLGPNSALASLGRGVDAVSTMDKDVNAGQIVREWIDYCTANSVVIPPTTIKRFGAGIKKALDGKVPAGLIRMALGEMFRDRVMTRPTLLDNYILRAQQGPELPPRKASRVEADLLRMDEDPTALFLRSMMNGAS